jgi:hypothetical protein
LTFTKPHRIYENSISVSHQNVESEYVINFATTNGVPLSTTSTQTFDSEYGINFATTSGVPLSTTSTQNFDSEYGINFAATSGVPLSTTSTQNFDSEFGINFATTSGVPLSTTSTQNLDSDYENAVSLPPVVGQFIFTFEYKLTVNIGWLTRIVAFTRLHTLSARGSLS